MKKNDVIMIGILFLIGILSLIGLKIYENVSSTGDAYANVYYQDTLILTIDLNTNEYEIYSTAYENEIDASRASEGIYYVPGTVTTDMTELYAVDSYAEEHQIVGIKLLVSDGKIEVAYQESPRDICELQNPTNSSTHPLVCLPNELVVNIVSSISDGEFVPDSVLS